MFNTVPLFHEYRLIEISENEVNGAWKGAHLLLFFLAFVFGSFCTFCFHMLMYLFEEKCVLFPKLLSLTSLRHNVIYEFIPAQKELADLPVDFLSTQWVEKSTCSLPTYVPLVSGIFGLVWTTMFLMCSTGSRTLTGLQRPWRLLPPVFLFSLAMGALCIYSSAVTHYGLQELCLKLGEITGSSTCTYAVNVATLTYERRIRGVYQATRLTILSAWLHTSCWLMSALLALLRVLLAIDFQLVRINVQLHGDIDKILERHEVHIRTVSPEFWIKEDYLSESEISLPTKVNIQDDVNVTSLLENSSRTLYFSVNPVAVSELSLVPQESHRIARLTACKAVPKTNQFIVKWLYDLLRALPVPEEGESSISHSSISSEDDSGLLIARQFGQAKILSVIYPSDVPSEFIKPDADEMNKGQESSLLQEIKLRQIKSYLDEQDVAGPLPSTSREEDSVMNLTPELRRVLKSHAPAEDDQDNTDDEKEEDSKSKIEKKSNLKTVGVQTEKDKSKRRLRVQISEKSFFKPDSESENSSEEPTKDDSSKETQTHPKEKQD